MSVIFLNCLVLSVEVSIPAESHGHAFEVFTLIFLQIYTLEFVLKVYHEPIGYWKNSYNLFDFLVLVVSYLDVVSLQGLDVTFIRGLMPILVLIFFSFFFLSTLFFL